MFPLMPHNELKAKGKNTGETRYESRKIISSESTFLREIRMQARQWEAAFSQAVEFFSMKLPVASFLYRSRSLTFLRS